MPLVTALSMIDTAFFTSSCALAALPSTALRAVFTAVRSDAIAARLRARCLIILRFCFSADLILATRALPGGLSVYPAPGGGVKAWQLRVLRGSNASYSPANIAGVRTTSVDKLFRERWVERGSCRDLIHSISDAQKTVSFIAGIFWLRSTAHPSPRAMTVVASCPDREGDLPRSKTAPRIA